MSCSIVCRMLQVASKWEGWRGECDRVVYFYYIVVRLPQLAEKVCNFILNSSPPFPLLSLAKFAAQVQHTHTQTYTENLLAHRLIRQELWQHTLRLTFKLPLMRSLPHSTLTHSKPISCKSRQLFKLKTCLPLPPLPLPLLCSYSIKNLFNVARRIPGNKQRMS